MDISENTHLFEQLLSYRHLVFLLNCSISNNIHWHIGSYFEMANIPQRGLCLYIGLLAKDIPCIIFTHINASSISRSLVLYSLSGKTS